MKRGIILILSCLIAACFAQLDASFDGTLQATVDSVLPLPSADLPDLTQKPPVVELPTDLNNTGNAFFFNKDLASIVQLVSNETEKDLAEKAKDRALDIKGQVLATLKDNLKDLFTEVQNKLGDDVQDLAVVARDLLESLVSRFRERKLEKFNDWFSHQSEFALKRAAIREARLNILELYKNTSTTLQTFISAGCPGLLNINVKCNLADLLNNAGLLADATVKNLLAEAQTKFDDLSTLVQNYQADLDAAASFFTDVDVDDSDDATVYSQVLDALKDRRTNVLPTWGEVVDKLKSFLANVDGIKNLLKKLWVGWELANNDITLTLPPVLDSTLQSVELTVSATIARDPAFPDAPLQEGADKLKALLKSLLQVYGAVDKVNIDLPSPVGVDGVATFVVKIYALSVNNARDLAKFFQNVDVTDLTPITTEFNDFVNGLNGDLAALSTQVSTQLTTLKSQYETQNAAAQQLVADQLQKLKDFYANSSADLDKYTGNAPNLVEFAQNLVGKYLETVNKTVSGLKANLDAVKSSIDEADARVQVVKQQIITLVEQIQAATDATVKTTLESALAKLKVQLQETLHDRELKKVVFQKASDALANLELKAKAQHDDFVANLADVANKVQKSLADVKNKVKSGFDDFVDSVKTALKAYRQTVDDIQVQAASDLNDTLANTLTFTVSIVDSGVAGELDVARKAKHTALLKAVFIAITTDVDIKVTTTPKRATTDTYTVQSATTPTPAGTTSAGTTSPAGTTSAGTTSPAGTTGAPTGKSSAFAIAISFFACFAGMFMLIL